jgi:tRNA (guanine9-N1)-methyltransferase
MSGNNEAKEALATEKVKPDDNATQAQQGESLGDNTSDASHTESTTPASLSRAPQSETGAAAVDDNTTPPKLSKNQLKRKQKLERMMELKRQKKEQKKSIKLAKAQAEGRDIDAERKDMEERRLDGKGWAKRNERWKERFEMEGGKFQVCLDCSFEEQMSDKEIYSLAKQIRYCYSTNKGAQHPVRVMVTSLKGKTLEVLQNVPGLEQWEHREFYHSDKDILEAYPDKSKLVYLTSDSETVLKGLDDDKVYIIGGIVDRNRLKRAAINRAEPLGIATAKLPISDHLDMTATKVLTCNHVFDILVKWKECDKDWKKTMLEVLPNRKDAKGRSDQ